ncbi:zinc ribbon domain-containing protein [Luteimicrobium album]|uniref:zinc ribbon domain-containing protein n=1 Tax=Luteimicrobium album TaxID=1054550 RepID=UPI003D6754AB
MGAAPCAGGRMPRWRRCQRRVGAWGRDVAGVPGRARAGRCRDLTLADRRWTCECGTTHDRDRTAALNLLRLAA